MSIMAKSLRRQASRRGLIWHCIRLGDCWVRKLPSIADVNEQRAAKFKERIANAVQSGQGKLFQELIETARSLGADLTIDVTTQDAAELVLAATDGRGADAVLEAVGIAATAAQSLHLVRSGGDVTWIGNSAPTVQLGMQELVTRELTVRGSYGFREEFEQAADALAAGTIDVRRIIERLAPLEEGPELFRELGAGELDAVKVVLTPNG